MTDERDEQQAPFAQRLTDTRTAEVAAWVVLGCMAGSAFVIAARLLKLAPDQIVIVCTGVVAVFLTQSSHESRRRWACVFGMLGQPAWAYAALAARQWGVLFVTFLYTLAWLRGVNTHWLQPWREKRRRMKYGEQT